MTPGGRSARARGADGIPSGFAWRQLLPDAGRSADELTFFHRSPVSAADRDLTRTYTRAQFAARLRRLADSIETGRPFTIQVAGERLRVPADVTFNVEHERSGTDEELEFQPLWRR